MVSITLVTARKSLIIMLAILFSTSIFATSSSIVYSINNFNEYIYGNENDVLIIYDESAQTPFTSRIPASYDLILNQIEGVDQTSPELIIPGIVNENAVMMRGVNISSFSSITPVELLEGNQISTNDKASIWIGEKVAGRLDLDVGDVINFQGSLLNNNAFLEIKGIIKGTPQIEDEIIAPLGVAEKLSRRIQEYNHIKVKFNPDITNEDTILDLLSGSYDISLTLYQNNNSDIVEGINVQVFDFSGEQVVYLENQTVINLELPFGEYEFVFSSNETIVFEETITVSTDRSYRLVIPDFSYNTTIATSTNQPSGGVLYEIIDTSARVVSNGTIIPSEDLDLILDEGQYTIQFSSPSGIVSEQLDITESNVFNIDLSNISYSPQIPQLDGTILPQNGTLFANNIISSVSYQINFNDSVPSLFTGYLQYSLAPGNYEVEISNELNQILQSYSIEISGDIGDNNLLVDDISFLSYNPNFGTYRPLKTMANVNWTDNISTDVLIYGSLQVPIGDNASLSIDGTSVSIENITEIVIPDPVIQASVDIKIINDLGLSPEDIIIEHPLLGNQTNPQRSGDDWFLSQFPIGDIIITIDPIGRSSTSFTLSLVPGGDIRLILEPANDVSLDKFLALRTQISADIATEFFNQELTGPFAFFRIALLAESIIITMLLLVNVSAVYAGVVSEHRFELRTMKNVGFTNNELVISIIKSSLKYSIPIILGGTLIGLGLSNLLLLTNNTILFGHQFVPVFPPIYWLVNLVVGHFLMYMGAWIGLFLESNTIANAS